MKFKIVKDLWYYLSTTSCRCKLFEIKGSNFVKDKTS